MRTLSVTPTFSAHFYFEHFLLSFFLHGFLQNTKKVATEEWNSVNWVQERAFFLTFIHACALGYWFLPFWGSSVYKRKVCTTYSRRSLTFHERRTPTLPALTLRAAQSQWNRGPQTGWFKGTEMYSLTFWKPAVWIQGVSRVGSF